ncbi:MAG: 2,3-bisphosphoglycerate-independent phosphoglycerate mutase [Planctomycetales bacterium]|nr:2,3-bisphosphoglycerate-independent phosphoglycerate mutase [bacterium]UNM09082.1 MAG: 2,3-bisphosphoglycerate-independent phosphoglycerate mutase [Planctomycetales bacterium]
MPRADKPVLLLILDGWGLAEDPSNSAIDLANTPTWDRIWREYPHTRLIPHGTHVGLMEGQMGNSEVGHLNLGAGRVVRQDLLEVTRLIDAGELATHGPLNEFLAPMHDSGGTLHFIGLFSDGGIHSHINHLLGLARHAASVGVRRIAIHALTDGRDTAPKCCEQYFELAQRELPDNAFFASVGGRYFLMDRDHRWERTQQHWDVITHGMGPVARDWQTAVAAARNRDEGDEFITPTVIGDYAGFEADDRILCFNFRADRMRQSVAAWTQPDFEGFDRGDYSPLPLFSVRRYEAHFGNPVLISRDTVDETLAQVVSQHGLTTYKSAETEKYAHVTYFFNGGLEKPWPGEERVLVPSPKVATYDLQPEMSVSEVTDRLVEDMQQQGHDLYVVNYANGDMVGHTGVKQACIAACETVDACLRRVLDEAGWGEQVTVIVTADHGNCDVLTWPDGTPHTQHSMNDSPFVLVSEPRRELKPPAQWSLRDVAPTILELLGIDKPASWDGSSLLDDKG